MPPVTKKGREDWNLWKEADGGNDEALELIIGETPSEVGEPPTITSATQIDVSTGDSINYHLVAEGGVGYEWGNIPQGCAIANGKPRNLIGSIASPGTYNVAMVAANYYGSDVKTLQIDVDSSFLNTKSVQFNVQKFLNASATTANPLYRASNGDGRKWTIHMWFKPKSRADAQSLFYFGGDLRNSEGSISASFDGGDNSITFFYGTYFNFLKFKTDANTFPQDEWTNLIITFDGGTTGAASNELDDYYGRFKFYANGSLVSTTNSSQNFGFAGRISTDVFWVGRNDIAAPIYEDGLTDELALWDTDEPSNVAAIYNGGVPHDLNSLGSKPDHWWRMGDGDTYPLLQDNAGSLDFTMTNMAPQDIVNDVP